MSYSGRLLTDERSLQELHRAHVTSIPFENIQVLLRGNVSLAADAIEEKLVRRRRGGYCYEHTLLFAAVLSELGFPTTLLAARVRMGSTRPRPRTHALLKVRAQDRDWLADVGFGGGGLLEPIPMADGMASRQEDWDFRLKRENQTTWVLQSRRQDGWLDLYSFGDEPHTPDDLSLMHHYMSTHPSSPFVKHLRVQKTHPEARIALNDLELTREYPDGRLRREAVDAGRLDSTLRDVFGIVLSRADARSLTAYAMRWSQGGASRGVSRAAR